MDTYLGPGLCAAAYVVGSVCFGPLFARRSGVDLRTVGSGNVGATNVGRAMGKGTGRLVLLLDAAKGALVMFVAGALLADNDPWLAGCGFAAVFGHCFSVFLRFRGGKGAATSLGVLLASVPTAGAIGAGTFVLFKAISKRTSVGSMTGAIAGGTAVAFLIGATRPLAVMAYAIVALVLVRHEDNIKRLIAGTEPAL